PLPTMSAVQLSPNFRCKFTTPLKIHLAISIPQLHNQREYTLHRELLLYPYLLDTIPRIA
ncbi:MAG: hypothetical protein ABIK15_13560, partial [Pseudomonadota bacterium]